MAEDKEKKYIKIGARYPYKGHWCYASSYIPNCDMEGERCFKDEEIYWKEPDEICYIGSSAFTDWDLDVPFRIIHIANDFDRNVYYKPVAFSHNDIVEKAKTFLKDNPSFKSILPEDLAYRVFLKAQWALYDYDTWPGTFLNRRNLFAVAAEELMKPVKLE